VAPAAECGLWLLAEAAGVVVSLLQGDCHSGRQACQMMCHLNMG